MLANLCLCALGIRALAYAPTQQLALAVAYDGAPFRGWTDLRDTALRPTLSRLLGLSEDEVVLTAASRTDAGVHADAQICTLPLRRPVADVGQLAYSLNQLLPESVSVRRAGLVSPSFDVRSNLHKEYRYRLSLCAVRDPLTRGHRWHVPPRRGRPAWDAEAATAAAQLLLGEHSFKAYGNRPKGREREVEVDPVCELRELRLCGELTDGEGEIELRIQADRFLYKMARNLVGAVVRVGEGRLTLGELEHAVAHGAFPQNCSPPLTAPAHGLILHRVNYEKSRGPFDWVED